MILWTNNGAEQAFTDGFTSFRDAVADAELDRAPEGHRRKMLWNLNTNKDCYKKGNYLHNLAGAVISGLSNEPKDPEFMESAS